jgi:hypothetical protein
VDPARLLARLRRGAFDNVAFTDARRLAEATGFELRRITGSHFIFRHPLVPDRLNLQQERGKAKPYQLRQLLDVIERYALPVEENG